MSTETTTAVAAVQVFRKHCPWNCACGFTLDGCCAPSTCPNYGRTR